MTHAGTISAKIAEQHVLSEFEKYRVRQVLRLNAKVNDTEAAGMKVSQQADKINVGDALDITFVTNVEYSLWNINITLFAACLLSNAIVKK